MAVASKHYSLSSQSLLERVGFTNTFCNSKSKQSADRFQPIGGKSTRTV